MPTSTTTRTRAKTSGTTTKSRSRVAIGLGANLGEAQRTLCAASAVLGEVIDNLRLASLYRSRPRSPLAQADFLNTALVGVTSLTPLDLLRLGKSLETLAGRRPGPVGGPRPLDVDLLLFGDQIVDTDALVVPHPRLRERRFVLAPLAELAPEWALPPDGATVRELLAAVGQEDEVQRLGEVC